MIKTTAESFKYEVNKKRFLNGVVKEFTSPQESTSVYACNRAEVGRAGEQRYSEYLSVILDSDICIIDWVNKDGESGKPYDFKVIIGEEEFYVDVKATKGRYNNDVFLSKREKEFSSSINNYYVARLYEWETDKGKLRAGNFNVKLTSLDKLSNLIRIN
jgi:hypothetical protein